jgi:hypothetical protein
MIADYQIKTHGLTRYPLLRIFCMNTHAISTEIARCSPAPAARRRHQAPGVNDDVFISALGQHQRQQAAPGTNIQDPLYAHCRAQAPNKMPSVPTFIAQRSCATKNWKKIHYVSVRM